ncbi:MAG: Glu-tRNA(Gln) amidotransferase subunit GatD [Thermoplasmataceae archaeon]
MTDMSAIKFGTSLKFSYSGNVYEGLFIHFDGALVTVKLSNGYNIVIPVESMDLIESRFEENGNSTPTMQAVSPAKRMSNSSKKVSLLATGGTIASKVDYKTGAVSPSQDVSFISDKVKGINVDAETIDNILSENITPDKWIGIAKRIKNGLDKNDGCVVFHGTDTMTYTASAISFMFSSQTGPIIFVGSQRSSDRPSSDAFLNAEGAIHLATTDFGEVGIAMHDSLSDSRISIHRAVRTRKMHTSRRDAFRSLGEKELGNYESGKVTINSPYTKVGDRNELMAKLEPSVSLIYFYPSYSPEDFQRAIEGKKAAILMGTGLGHVSHSLMPVISEAVMAGKKVMMTSQCLNGAVNLNVYSTGRELLESGVIPLHNMLPEVALVKAMYVLGNFNDDQFKDIMQLNLRGEIIEREFAGSFEGLV